MNIQIGFFLFMALFSFSIESKAESFVDFLARNKISNQDFLKMPALKKNLVFSEFRKSQNIPVAGNAVCKQYGSGCRDCKNPETPKSIQVESTNHTITIEKPGQNYLDPSLIEVLKKMVQEKNQSVIVTSGFRSCAYQRATRQGVKRSQHLLGKAADFHLEQGPNGSSQLAKFARSILNKLGMGGGVGIYRGSYSHVDTGPNRNWDWR